MSALDTTDRLEVVGVLAGLFIILGGLGTLVGTPWTAAGGTGVAVVQVIGIALSLALGAGLVWLSCERG
jgi:hypothetical protein